MFISVNVKFPRKITRISLHRIPVYSYHFVRSVFKCYLFLYTTFVQTAHILNRPIFDSFLIFCNIPELMWSYVDNSPFLLLNTHHVFPVSMFDMSLGQKKLSKFLTSAAMEISVRFNKSSLVYMAPINLKEHQNKTHK